MITLVEIGMSGDSGRIDVEKSIGHGRTIRRTNGPAFLAGTTIHKCEIGCIKV
jgi:hypothetical protein